MTRPEQLQQADTPGSLDQQIATLVQDFQQAPYQCFHEKELHAKFFSQCRDAFPTYLNAYKRPVAAFRYQYATLWRYKQGERFAERYSDTGTTASFDFVILQQRFVERSDYLSIVDSDAQRRTLVEAQLGEEFILSCDPVQSAIELKMTPLRGTTEISAADVNRLEDRMLVSCCKLAQERIKQAYVVGLSQGPFPDPSRAHTMISACLRLHQARYADGSLRVLVATPTQTVLGGDWPEEIEFPNVVARGGWPAPTSMPHSPTGP